MQRIGFFGGCFNPPTNIHIKIANNLIEQGKLDKVIFVPVNDYYKKLDLVEAKHRYNMLKLATMSYDDLEVDDIEIKENRMLFAIDAFEVIHNSIFAKDSEVYFIMGSDNYKKMPNWKEYEKIKDKYSYVIINRNENEISSTKIRDMIKNDNKKVSEFLSQEVYEYIVENDLYKL